MVKCFYALGSYSLLLSVCPQGCTGMNSTLLQPVQSHRTYPQLEENVINARSRAAFFKENICQSALMKREFTCLSVLKDHTLHENMKVPFVEEIT